MCSSCSLVRSFSFPLRGPSTLRAQTSAFLTQTKTEAIGGKFSFWSRGVGGRVLKEVLLLLPSGGNISVYAQIRNILWGNTKMLDNILLLLLSRFSRVRLCATPQTAAHQAPPSLGFSRQEHWSGLPFPSPMHESEKWKWSRSGVPES